MPTSVLWRRKDTIHKADTLALQVTNYPKDPAPNNIAHVSGLLQYIQTCSILHCIRPANVYPDMTREHQQALQKCTRELEEPMWRLGQKTRTCSLREPPEEKTAHDTSIDVVLTTQHVEAAAEQLDQPEAGASLGITQWKKETNWEADRVMRRLRYS